MRVGNMLLSDKIDQANKFNIGNKNDITKLQDLII